METTGLGFPFTINNVGRVATLSGNGNLHARIIQVLMTAPGERVNLPEFGCGLRELVFDPNNEILAAATEFTVNKALQQWLGDEILVQSVDISHTDEQLQIEVVYLRRDRMETGKVQLAF